MTEIIDMTTPEVPTPRGICPFTMTPRPPPTIDLPPGIKDEGARKIDYASCVGPACHLWMFEPGANPNMGDCSYRHEARAISILTNAVMNVLERGQATSSGDA